MNHLLNEKTQAAISKHVGLDINKIREMSFEEIDLVIEKKIKHKLVHKTDDVRFMGRGSVYLFLSRLLNIDIINKKLSKI